MNLHLSLMWLYVLTEEDLTGYSITSKLKNKHEQSIIVFVVLVKEEVILYYGQEINDYL